MNTTAKYEIRSVTRALDVLVTVSELGEADLTTIARAAGLHPTTTLRVLESLRSRGFVRNRRGLYEIGPRAFEVGSTFLNRVSLAHEAQALVEELAERLLETRTSASSSTARCSTSRSRRASGSSASRRRPAAATPRTAPRWGR